MVVKKNSWHYRLVKGRNFVSDLKKDNCDAMNYIVEVYLDVFLRGFFILSILIGLSILFVEGLHSFLMDKTPIPVLVVFLIGSSPVWFTFLSILIEPFTKKTWRRLKVSD